MYLSTDSTIIASPQNLRFSLSDVPWLLDTGKDVMTETNFHVFLLFAKGPLNDACRDGKGRHISGDTAEGAGYKTGDFVQGTPGGATAERCSYRRFFSLVAMYGPRKGQKCSR